MITPKDLKPLLDRVSAEFPGEECKVAFAQTSEKAFRNTDDFDVTIVVNEVYSYASSFEAAFKKAKASYDPRRNERFEAAAALRKKADALENGEVEI